ncbi:MAG: hypothetical protein ACRCW0_03305 [Clostridium sp.]
MKKLLITLLILTSVSGSFIACGTNTSSSGGKTVEQNFARKAETLAENYVKAIFDGDYEKALTMVNLPEGAVYTAEDIQSNYIEKNIIPTKVDDIDSIKNKSESATKGIIVNYKIENEDGETEKNFLEIPTIKTEDGKWAVDVSYNSTKDYFLGVPTGTVFKIDGKDITAPKVEKNTDESEPLFRVKYNAFTLPLISNREHTLTVEHPTCETFKKTFTPGDKLNISLEASEEFKKKALEFIKETRETILNSAKANKPFDEIKNLFSAEASFDFLKSSYDTLKAYLNGGYEENGVKNIYSKINYENYSVYGTHYKGNNNIYMIFDCKLNTSRKSIVGGTMGYDFPNSSRDHKFGVLLKLKDDGSLTMLGGRSLINPIV